MIEKTYQPTHDPKQLVAPLYDAKQLVEPICKDNKQLVGIVPVKSLDEL